jgi:hypothetical protein
MRASTSNRLVFMPELTLTADFLIRFSALEHRIFELLPAPPLGDTI